MSDYNFLSLQLKKEREDYYKPKILIDVNLEQSQQREKELQRERERENERAISKERQRMLKERYVREQASRELASINAEPIDSDSSSNDANAGGAPASNNSNENNNNHHQLDDENSQGGGTPPLTENHHHHHSYRNSSEAATPPAMNTSMISLNLGAANAKKKQRLEMRDVFSIDDDGEDVTGPKKRKLVPLDYEEKAAAAAAAAAAAQKEKAKGSKDGTAVNNGTAALILNNPTAAATIAAGKKTSEELAKSQEERRKHIKSIIDKIPTEKNDLFNYKLDWNEIDNGLMEKKIRPWINKKIIEYIGEPEPTLVDFICSKVMAGSTPQGILDDVQMVSEELKPFCFEKLTNLKTDINYGIYTFAQSI